MRASSPALTFPMGVAVDSAHVYWTEFTNRSIGRANLDGTGVNPNFITGAPIAAVAVAAQHHWVWSCACIVNASRRHSLSRHSSHQMSLFGERLAVL